MCLKKTRLHQMHDTPKHHQTYKSWYKGTVEPETFDADTSVFNEYEVANIQKIADTEGKLRSEGK